MVEKPRSNQRLDAVETFSRFIENEFDRLMKHTDVVEEPKRRVRLLDLELKDLTKIVNLPVNSAQICNIKLMLVEAEEELMFLKAELKDRKIERTEIYPKTRSIYINFQDKSKPQTTFIYFIDLKDGEDGKTFITQKNIASSKIGLIDKPSYRSNQTTDLKALSDLLAAKE